MRPLEAQIWPEFEIFGFFRDFGVHEAELEAPTIFSRTHRRTRDPDHSTDQSL